MSAGVRLLRDGEIEEKVIELVARARERYRLPDRCCAEAACEALGLPIVRGQLPRGTDGALRSTTIVISSAIEMMSRYEYTVFHEIVHHLLDTDEDADLIDYFTDALHNDPQGYDRAIERCCQMGAAEFLIPRHRARAIIAERGFSVDLVEPLAGINGASILASAVQLAVCAPVDCYVVICAYGLSPLWPHNNGLYVEQAVRRDGMRYPIARGTMIPADHLFSQVWQVKTRLEGSTSVPFRSGKSYPCEHAEAKMVGTRVVGVLYCGHPPRKGQLSLGLPLN